MGMSPAKHTHSSASAQLLLCHGRLSTVPAPAICPDHRLTALLLPVHPGATGTSRPACRATVQPETQQRPYAGSSD